MIWENLLWAFAYDVGPTRAAAGAFYLFSGPPRAEARRGLPSSVTVVSIRPSLPNAERQDDPITTTSSYAAGPRKGPRLIGHRSTMGHRETASRA